MSSRGRPTHLFLVRETGPTYGSAPSPVSDSAPDSDPFSEIGPTYGSPDSASTPAPDSDPFSAPDSAYTPAPDSDPFSAPDSAYTPAPDSDPFSDADALEELEEEIATLSAHIHAATHRLLTLIAEYDRRRGWELGGHRSCAHWLSFRTGIDLGAAREKVRAARALEELPLASASMARGELSFSKIRALTRVATPENEEDLVELARGSTAAQLERMIRAFARGSRKEEAELDRMRYERRSLSVFPDEEGR